MAECKWRAVDLDAASLRAFRGAYPGGVNYVVASDVDRPVERRYGNLTVRCVSPAQLIDDVICGIGGQRPSLGVMLSGAPPDGAP